MLLPLAAATCQVGAAWAQEKAQGAGTIAVAESVTVVADARYQAGWMKRWLLGGHYRSLWATPLDVPVLDLEHTADGLAAEQRGGRNQTLSLRFRASDGREFMFGSLDKNPAPLLAPELRGTVVQDLVQDQISAAHPAGPLVAAATMRIVGVAGPSPALVALPASDRLGEFGAEFAGMLGYLQPNAEDGLHLGPGQPRFVEVVGSERMIAGLRREPAESVAAGRYLAARLVDFFLGDWDRHRGQLRWGRRSPSAAWEPIQIDRDQALVRFDGLLLALARQRSAPQLVKFDRDIPLGGLTWNGRDLDRMILPRLTRAAWDSITAYVVARLDDPALDSIVSVVPAAFGERHRAWLRATLASRRGKLTDVSRRFRALIARTPDLLLTDAAERIDLTSDSSGAVRVAVYTPEGDRPSFEHTFLPDETSEVRIYALGGADSIRTRGRGSRVRVHLIGGEGRDGLVSRPDPWLDFVEGGDRWREAPGKDSPPPWRDWGSRTTAFPTFGFAGDQGLVAGYWVQHTSYGFRRFPHASSWKLQGVMSSGTGRPGLAFDADVQSRDSAWFLGLTARAGGAERMRWYGVGNETAELNDRDRHLLDNWQLQLEPTFNLRLTRHLIVGAGPTLRFTRTTADRGRLLAADRPYGIGDFGEAGAVASLQWDPQSGQIRPRSAFRAEIGGRLVPAVWDVDSTYGAIHAAVSGRLGAGGPLQPSLTLAVRGDKIFGTAPFFSLATIGGAGSLRGFPSQRFRGDRSVVANSEARIRLAGIKLVLPADFGLLGLADAGRVALDGETSDRWHAAGGGGVWFSWLNGAGSFAISLAASDERTTLYAGASTTF